jgi:hypothetical protein
MYRAPGLFQSDLFLLDQAYHFVDSLNVIGDACFHRWRHA